MGRGAVPTEVLDAAGKGADGAEEGVATGSMADLLATVGIFLVRESEDAEGSSEEVVVGGEGEVELALANPELKLVGVERVGGILASGGAVLAWPHEEVIGNDDEVGNRTARFRSGWVGVGLADEVAKDLDGDRLDAPRRRVGLGVVPELVAETEVDGPLAV
jgi:hypothetical protein